MQAHYFLKIGYARVLAAEPIPVSLARAVFERWSEPESRRLWHLLSRTRRTRYVAYRESAELAKRLIDHSCRKQFIGPAS